MLLEFFSFISVRYVIQAPIQAPLVAVVIAVIFLFNFRVYVHTCHANFD